MFYLLLSLTLLTDIVYFCLLSYQPSFDKVVSPSFLELGLGELVSIYSELCALGKPPPVIDAADLQQSPEVVDLF